MKISGYVSNCNSNLTDNPETRPSLIKLSNDLFLAVGKCKTLSKINLRIVKIQFLNTRCNWPPIRGTNPSLFFAGIISCNMLETCD